MRLCLLASMQVPKIVVRDSVETAATDLSQLREVDAAYARLRRVSRER